MVTFYTGGAIGLGFGVAAIGVQATRDGRCDGTCQAAYAMGGTGLGLGALDVLGGVLFTVSRSTSTPTTTYPSFRLPRAPQRVALAPVPIFLSTEHGPAFGAGLAGVVF